MLLLLLLLCVCDVVLIVPLLLPTGLCW